MNLINQKNIWAKKARQRVGRVNYVQKRTTVNYLKKKAKLNCFKDRSTHGKTIKKSKEIIITKSKYIFISVENGGGCDRGGAHKT